jgi:hypothetical protein
MRVAYFVPSYQNLAFSPESVLFCLLEQDSRSVFSNQPTNQLASELAKWTVYSYEADQNILLFCYRTIN